MNGTDPQGAAGPSGQQSSLGGWVATGWRRLVRAWRHGVFIQERLLELSRPWETEGPLRWQRRSDGWRLLGSHLPPFPG